MYLKSGGHGPLVYMQTLVSASLETGPPPSGQLNAGVRKEEGLARWPCRAWTQECGHLQFEAMRVHTPTVNSGLAVNMVTYCKTCGHYILSVKYNRRLSSGVIASVVCADQLRRAVALSLTGTFFLAKDQAQESCYSVTEIYGELSCVGTSTSTREATHQFWRCSCK